MTDDQTKKRQFPERHERDRQEPSGDRRQNGDKPERKTSTVERREWRGSGVCGDRHTD